MNLKELTALITEAGGSENDPIVYIDINDPEKAEDLTIKRTPFGIIVSDSDEQIRRVLPLEKQNAELIQTLSFIAGRCQSAKLRGAKISYMFTDEAQDTHAPIDPKLTTLEKAALRGDDKT